MWRGRAVTKMTPEQYEKFSKPILEEIEMLQAKKKRHLLELDVNKSKCMVREALARGAVLLPPVQ